MTILTYTVHLQQNQQQAVITPLGGVQGSPEHLVCPLYRGARLENRIEPRLGNSN